MKTLSGVLEFSMGNFLCLRGYIDYKTLSAISKENKDVQRELIEKHKGEMASFLNSGEYRFFPEIVLSVSVLSNNNYSEVSDFFSRVSSKEEWNKKLGDIYISVYNHKAGDKNRIAHITIDETKTKLNRIDGNHRLSAANEVTSDFKVPFCLIICQNPDEENRYSRAIFHNINAKQIPLNLEENLKVILGSPEVFSDEKLKTDPSFGWEYYLARKILQMNVITKYAFINLLANGSECTYLVEIIHSLIESGVLSKDESSVEVFVNQFPKIETALQEAKLKSVPQNMSVIGALSYYKLVDSQKFIQFIEWIKKNCIAEALDIHINDLINIYDRVFDNTPKNVFMSMWYSEKTCDTYQTLLDVQKTLKAENGVDFRIIRVDQHKDGYSDEIYHRIVDGIEASSLVVADLSYGNRNVHHEIGFAQGRGKKILLLYQLRSNVDPKNEIGSNLSMHDQLRFKTQTELRPKLLRRIRDYFGIYQ